MTKLKETAAVLGLMLAGLVWPDIDQAIPFLPHRSGLTHSVLLPLALLGAGILRGPLLGGLLLGLGISLTADLFPRHWIGFAEIYLPLWGSLGWLSPAWLAANVLAALILAHVELTAGGRRHWPWLTYGAAALLSVAYAILVEHSLWPLLAFPALWVLSVKLATRAFGPRAGP